MCFQQRVCGLIGQDQSQSRLSQWQGAFGAVGVSSSSSSSIVVVVVVVEVDNVDPLGRMVILFHKKADDDWMS